MLSDRRGAELGTILTEVRHDLKHLKNELLQRGGEGIDLTALNQAIERTEDKIRTKAEQVVVYSSNEVTTLLPPIPPTAAKKSLQPHAHKKTKKAPVRPTHLTPGQLVKHQRNMGILLSPTHPTNRKVLQDTYGIVTTDDGGTSSKRSSQPSSQRKAITGSMSGHLTLLPSPNRRTSTVPPPVVSSADAKKGLMSLLERGFIPPATDIQLNPPPFVPQQVQLHEQGTKVRSAADKRVAENKDTAARWATVKLDTTNVGQETVKRPTTTPPPPPPIKKMIEVKSLALDMATSRAGQGAQTPPPSTPDGVVQKLAIHGGELLTNSKEFYLFKSQNTSNWGPIVTMLRKFEQLSQHYAIPILFLDSHKIASLASEYELEHFPSIEVMMECVINKMAVDQLLNQKGRRYKGTQGRHLAAAKIQATYRMYRQRTTYIEYRRKQWAAGVIMMSWLMYMKLFNVKEKLKNARKQHLENFHNRTKVLRDSWDRITQCKRLIIHLPSRGYPQHVRATIKHFPTMQSLQMARLCDVKDPNIDVIYISPVKISKEVEDYYQQLLAMRPTPRGNYWLLHPENIHKFRKHSMSLATLMKYSPRAMKRLENLIAGRETYIVTDVVSYDDLGLSDRLNIPILSADPDVSHLYSNKSGAKRIFTSAEVTSPASIVDVFSMNQLVEGLASLIVNNLNIRRWLFKIDDQTHGRGIAYCDVTDHLKCYSWALKERDRFGEKWSKRWAQEYTLQRVISEIPSVLSSKIQFSDPSLFNNWDLFLDAFFLKGGVIEAYPPSDSITSITANMMIVPNGAISLLCTGDQICPEPFRVWGVSLPQCSIEQRLLEEICHRIAKACRSRGIIGYFSIDFVTFISPDNGDQQLWATGLNISYGDLTSLYGLLNYVTNCKTVDGELLLPVKDEYTTRYAVLSNQLFHSNLAVLQYPVFFQICKAHLIGYDIEAQKGTLFALVESSQRESIGMITVGNSLEQAISNYARNLSIIHQEVSTPSTPGYNNFQSVCKELEKISELLLQNQNDNNN